MRAISNQFSKSTVAVHPSTQKAMLVCDISYVKDGVEVTVSKFTTIFVDQAKGIALIGDDHVDIDSDEYILSF